MNLIFLEPEHREHLLPLAWTRPVCDFRIGILTIREKWEKRLGASSSHTLTQTQNDEHDPQLEAGNLLIAGNVCPTPALVAEAQKLQEGEALYCGDDLVALHSPRRTPEKKIQSNEKPVIIHRLHDLFTKNGRELQQDFDLLTEGKQTQALAPSNRVTGKGKIFLEAGAKVECAILNTDAGPIYIGKDAEVMEGCIIRGPFALCEQATLKLGAKIYGPTTIGPGCKVGGEVNNSVLFANSNKAHDGFLGNSVIGEWCNLGADTNNSNLKNNYGEVSLYNYALREPEKTGLQFCGLIMGDHARCGINTMFNTGTVVGVSANVFGGGFPATFIPDFSWGGAEGFETYRLDKALETMERVLARRNKNLGDAEKHVYAQIFAQTQPLRSGDREAD